MLAGAEWPPLWKAPGGRLPGLIEAKPGPGPVGGLELSWGRPGVGGWLGSLRPALFASCWNAAFAGCVLERWIDGSDGTVGALGLPPFRFGWLARDRTLLLSPESLPRPRSRIAPLILSGSTILRWFEEREVRVRHVVEVHDQIALVAAARRRLVRRRPHVLRLDEQDLLLVALGAEVGDVERLDDAVAGEVVDQVDLRDDRGRALDEHGARAVLLELREPVDPVADAARIDALDLAEVDDGGPGRDPLDEVAELVILVDDAAELHVAHVAAVLNGRLELLAHRPSAT